MGSGDMFPAGPYPGVVTPFSGVHGKDTTWLHWWCESGSLLSGYWLPVTVITSVPFQLVRSLQRGTSGPSSYPASLQIAHPRPDSHRLLQSRGLTPKLRQITRDHQKFEKILSVQKKQNLCRRWKRRSKACRVPRGHTSFCLSRGKTHTDGSVLDAREE